ncbi:MAG: DNA repair exonuclease [Candidatus Gastranaerophilales bacterium]|nr:DNA repair exonuclease [Candidatus Gastranaerophilales bacterium]
MSFSFIHLSDIHLGRPFSGLSEYSHAENKIDIYKSAVEKSLEKVFNFAVDKKVDFILISGDTFDSSEFDFSSKFIFKNFLKKLEKENIQVFVVCGNHDPIFSYNKNTFNFDENSQIKIVGVNTPVSVKLPFYRKDNQIGGYIHSVSFKEEKFNSDILSFVENIEQNYFNIALLHCDIDATTESPYAPCALSQLKDMNFDYCALGHIHTPQQLTDNVFYSGTLQGRNTKEKGEHGVRYIKVQNNKVVENEFVPMDVVRYEELEINLSNTNEELEAFELICEEINQAISSQQNLCETYLISLKLVGCVSFYSLINNQFYEDIFERIQTYSSFEVYISQIENLTTPRIDDEVLKNDDGIAGELYHLLENEEDLQTIYSKVFDDVGKVCSSTLNKDEILYLVQQEAKKLCSNIYNDKKEG